MKPLKPGQLTHKDMSVLKEGYAPKVQHKMNHAPIRDYSLRHIIKMSWNYKEPNREQRPFRLHIDDKTYLLSWEELRDYDRYGFFRREEEPSTHHLKVFDGPKIIITNDLNEEAEDDVMFQLNTKDGHEVILDWYEMMRAGRFI